MPSRPPPKRFGSRQGTALISLVLACAAVAQAAEVPAPLELEEVQRLAVEASVDVATRRADVDVARRDLERTRRDPLATLLDRLQAENVLAAALEAQHAAELAAKIAALQRYAAVIEAEDALAAAAGTAEIAERQAAADAVRATAGLITSIDLARAEQDAGAAVRARDDARNTLDLARSELALLVGQPAAAFAAAPLAPLATTLPTLPPIDEVVRLASGGHAGIAAAERALRVAELRLAGGDHEGTAPNALAVLRSDVAAAERRLSDTRANAVLNLRSSYQSCVNAFARFVDAEASLETARTTFAAHQVRAEAGELSAIAVRQAELDLARAEATRTSALHAAWLAWHRLEQARDGV